MIKWYLIALIGILSIEGMESDAISKEVSKIDLVPEFCAALGLKLFFEPFFKGSGSLVHPCSVLPLESRDDCAICHIMAGNAYSILGKYNWFIREFGIGKDNYVTPEGVPLERGITLWIYKDSSLCSHEDLKATYKMIIEKVKSNWAIATLSKIPNVLYKYPESDYILLVKKDVDCVGSEAPLLFSIIGKYNLDHNKIRTNNDMGAGYDGIYLWIKKDYFKEFQSAFNFYITNPTESR